VWIRPWPCFAARPREGFARFRGLLRPCLSSLPSLCFVEEPGRMLAEARRVLKPGAPLVVGFVDRESELGQHYLTHQAENVFYREATFYCASDVEQLLRDAGFVRQTWGQTLSKPLDETIEMEPLRKGHGDAGFVVVAATES
jgi:ubiquinone/menaquinone biosynthesis C-methylase UbiE